MNPKKTVIRITISLSLAGLLLALLAAGLWANSAYPLTRLTMAGSDRDSFAPSINSDGSKIAFWSDADFLGQGIPDNQYEIWLYDATTLTFTRLTTGGIDRANFFPSINSDGSKVAFWGDADFLGQGIPNNQYEIWLYDATTLTVTRVTTSGSDRGGYEPSINSDGSKIAFHSDADFLGQGIPNNQFEIWLYDATMLTVTRVTTSGSGRGSRHPSINSDGSKIVFHSDADFLDQGIPNYQREIWLYDATTLTVTRLTTSGSGRESFFPSINSNGSKIAFVSDADFLGQGIPPGQNEIWLYDTAIMTVTRLTTVAQRCDPTVCPGSSYPNINSDGSKIAFVSDVDFLGQEIPRDRREIWLYDTATMTLTRLTTTSSGYWGNIYPSINSDGSKIAFQSNIDFLGYGMPGDQEAIWLADSFDLALTKQTTGIRLEGDEITTITYTVSVNNVGVGNASGVVIRDTLPLSVTFVSSRASNGSSYNPTTGLWEVGQVTAGAGVTLTLVVSGTKLEGRSIVNRAVLSASTPTDLKSANNTVSVTSIPSRYWLPIILKQDNW